MRKDTVMYLNIQINEQKEITRNIKLNNRIVKQNEIIQDILINHRSEINDNFRLNKPEILKTRNTEAIDQTKNNINNEEGNNEISMEPFTKNESKSLKNLKIDKLITKKPMQALKQEKP